ncbi:MAG: GWxTD domain-containing protein [bacterium]|nr:GWxTD domain-containing protein [bacterium]
MNILFLSYAFLIGQVNLDVARFVTPDNQKGLRKTRCEIYIGFPYNILFYRTADRLSTDNTAKLNAKFKIKVTVKTDSGKAVANEEWEKVSSIESLAKASSHNANILEQLEILLDPGNYKIETVVVQDSSLPGDKVGKWETAREIEIRKPDTTLSLSDIQLSSSIDTFSSDSRFVKNGLNIIPLPQRIIGTPYKSLYSYTEIYNLKPKTNYEMKYSILNDSGVLVAELSPKSLKAEIPNLTEIECINIEKITSGNYILVVEVNQDNKKVTRRKAFIVRQQPEQLKEQPVEVNDDMEYLSFINYIATPEELATYNKLSNTGKQKFLTEFWKKRSKEERLGFIERVKYADRNYSSWNEKGRYSDMGRILIKYGKQDDQERFPPDATYHSIEKWSYYSKGGMVFIFVDIRDIGRYELYYSSIKEVNSKPTYRQYIPEELLE